MGVACAARSEASCNNPSVSFPNRHKQPPPIIRVAGHNVPARGTGGEYFVCDVSANPQANSGLQKKGVSSMPDLPLHWGAYLRLQTKLARKRQVDDHTWGLEAGLNRILTATIASDEDADRTVRSEGRKERYRTHLRHVYLNTDDLIVKPIPENVVHARRQLLRMSARVTAEEWALLRAVGVSSTRSLPSQARRRRARFVSAFFDFAGSLRPSRAARQA